MTNARKSADCTPMGSIFSRSCLLLLAIFALEDPMAADARRGGPAAGPLVAAPAGDDWSGAVVVPENPTPTMADLMPEFLISSDSASPWRPALDGHRLARTRADGISSMFSFASEQGRGPPASACAVIS